MQDLVQKHARIIDVSVDLATSDLYGKLTSGRLVLHAPFLGISAPHLRPHPETPYPTFQDDMWRKTARVDRPEHHMFYQQHAFCEGQQYGLVQLCTTKPTNKQSPTEVLYMIVVETTAAERDQYRRVGTYSLPLSGQLVQYGRDIGAKHAVKEDRLREELLGAVWARKRIEIV